MTLDLAAIEATQKVLANAYPPETEEGFAAQSLAALLAAVRTLEAENAKYHSQLQEFVWVEGHPEEYETELRTVKTRVTALEVAARQLIAKWEGIVRDCDFAGALLPHSGIVAEGFKVCAEELAAALLTKEGV